MKPSVTQLTALLDKPALLKWANKIGLQGIPLDKYRKKVMSDGTSLHKQIELKIKKGIVIENKILRENYDVFIQDKIILECEKYIENEFWVGRYDLKMEYNGYVYLCDFKRNQKNVYLENKLQLIAYSLTEKVDRLAIIGVPDFNIIVVDIIDYEPYIEILKSLSNIFINKEKLINHF